MASGHHAEVVKDLNGYTIRDLGSTNGIMVNGQPTTEAPLAHGTRLRVGGTRFIFRDPSMKEVEVELAKLEDDDGWGMMGDIDLSRARVSKAGTLSTLAFLALVGAGGFFLMKESDKPAPAAARTSPPASRSSTAPSTRPDLPWSLGRGRLAQRRARAGPQAPARGRERGRRGRARRGRGLRRGDPREPRSHDPRAGQAARPGRAARRLAQRRRPRHAAPRPSTFTQVLGGGRRGRRGRAALAFPSWASRADAQAARAGGGARHARRPLRARHGRAAARSRPATAPACPARRSRPTARAAIQTNRTPLAVAITAGAWKGSERLLFLADEAPVKDDLTVRVKGRFLAGDTALPGQGRLDGRRGGPRGRASSAPGPTRSASRPTCRARTWAARSTS